jgi:hypothetical protein
MKKTTLIIIGVLLFIALLYLISGKFLTYNKSVHSPYVLLEGWISQYNMEFAANYIIDKNYDSVFIVGMKTPNNKTPIQEVRKIKKAKEADHSYFLTRNGILGFIVPTEKTGSNSILNITMRGSSALNLFPHYQVFANEQLVGSGFVNENDSIYTFDLSNKIASPITYISINYDNDIMTSVEDRNLIISDLYIDSKNIDSISLGDFYIHNGQRMHYEFISGLKKVKYYLADRGYDTSKVKLIGLEPKSFNKSIAIAKGAEEYFGQSNIESINIITIRNHSGRSVFNFKKAIRNIEFGSIIINNHSEYENSLMYRIDERMSLLFTWMYWWFH